jgi:hypothetical protein
MSDNLILTLLGAVGVGALVMGMNNDNKNENKQEIKETFWNGIALRSIAEQGALPASSMQQATASGNAQVDLQGINFASGAGVNMAAAAQRMQTGSQQPQQRVPIFELFQDSQQQSLGANPVTKNDYPFVSYPNFQQSIPLRSPDIKVPAQIRYNPPSLDKMGITEAYQCSSKQSQNVPRNGTVIENYMATVPTENPGPNYAAGNYNEVLQQAKKDNPGCGVKVQESLPLGSMEGIGSNGEPENFMVFDRLMTTTMKPGRTRQKGVSDLIRGDLPVCVDPCQKGWFQASAKPTDLSSGALSVIAGKNEHDASFAEFVKMYGSTASTFGGGHNYSELPNKQQYSTMDMLMTSGGGFASPNINVAAFS